MPTHSPPIPQCPLASEQPSERATKGLSAANSSTDWHALANGRTVQVAQRRAPVRGVSAQSAAQAPIQRWFWGDYYWLKTGDTYEWKTGTPDTTQLVATEETRYYSENPVYSRLFGNFQYPVYTPKPPAKGGKGAKKARSNSSKKQSQAPKASVPSPASSKKPKPEAPPKDPYDTYRRASRDNLRQLEDAASSTYSGNIPPEVAELIREAQELIGSYAGDKQDKKTLRTYLKDLETEIVAYQDETFQEVGKKEKLWTVADFENARGGRKGKFKSLIEQGLIQPGHWERQYFTSYDPSGGFATAISVDHAPGTVIHTHYAPDDTLRAAHFKPRAEEGQKGHSLNSLTPGQIPTFVDGPMAHHYGGGPPWGDSIADRKP